MAGSLLKNLQLFKDLCGADAMLKVIVVTTMWGEVREESGIKREEQLKKEFWGGILDNGGKTARFQDSFESAWGIIENLTERKEDCVLLSKEMVDRRLSLNETRVGRTLQEELKRLVKDQKQASRKLQDQAGKQRNEQAAKELLKRKEEIELKIDQVANQLSKLKISLPKQVLGFFRWRASEYVDFHHRTKLLLIRYTANKVFVEAEIFEGPYLSDVFLIATNNTIIAHESNHEMECFKFFIHCKIFYWLVVADKTKWVAFCKVGTGLCACGDEETRQN